MKTIVATCALLLLAPAAHAQSGGGGGSSATSQASPKPDTPTDRKTKKAEAAEDRSLLEAYQKEFAFLAGQKRQLQQRLDRLETRTKREKGEISREIDQLQQQVLRQEGQASDLRDELDALQRASSSDVDQEQLIEATLDQAKTTLKDYDIDAPEEKEEGDESAAPVVERAFDASLDLLDRLSRVRKESAQFFLTDGTKVDGDVVYLGRIAAYGVSDEGAGALAPAGGGKLKLWSKPSADVARALAEGRSPSTLKIFLYESLDAQVDEDEGETAAEHVADGGTIAWVIVSLGALGLLLILLRTFLLSRAGGSVDEIERKVGAHVRAGQIDRAIDAARGMGGSAARAVANVLESLQRGTDRLDDVISEGLLNEGRRIHRFGAVILVIAAVSPLLGLLGTVTGMIATFDVITKFGTGDPKLLSGGISTALITTELGLIVAIPTLLLGNLLSGWGDRVEAEAERAVLRVVNIHSETGGTDPEERSE